MKGIKCAGDIALSTPFLCCHANISIVKSENFEDYGIEIKVQFRDNAPLTTLTAQTQSGGVTSIHFIANTNSTRSVPFPQCCIYYPCSR